MQKRIETLDELRALAIAAVILSHFALAFGSRSIVAFWLNLPDLSVGVDLFFVISGFLIFRNLSDLNEAAGDFTRGVAAFYARRLTRIALPAWTILAVIALANLERPALSANDLWAAAAFVANVHWARCEIDARCGDALATSHFWSLASEAQFYLLAPALLLARGRAPLYAAIAAILLLAVIPRPHGSLLWALRPESLLLGAALASEARRRAAWLENAPPVTAGMAAWWILVASMMARIAVGAFAGLAWALVALISAGVVLGRLKGPPMDGPVGNAVRRVGRVSFSIYLVHLPLIGVAAESYAATIGVPAALFGALAAIAAATMVVELAMVRPAAQFGRAWSARIASNDAPKSSGSAKIG
ncbi:MAG: acyltransferase [Alphaproteobacteria bacterium]|nr:acyltransferase [Alphaproteobacteria bacterium]